MSTLERGTVTFVGKDGSERRNPMGTKSIRALDRYTWIRSGHREPTLGLYGSVAPGR
jgi:site-specific recombinase XerC